MDYAIWAIFLATCGMLIRMNEIERRLGYPDAGKPEDEGW